MLPSISQILGLLVVRKMLDMVFSQHHLAWVDDILPGKDKKKKEDEKKNTKKIKKKGKGGDDSEDVSVLVARLLWESVGCWDLNKRSFIWLDVDFTLFK